MTGSVRVAIELLFGAGFVLFVLGAAVGAGVAKRAAEPERLSGGPDEDA